MAKYFIRRGEPQWRLDTQDIPTSVQVVMDRTCWLQEIHIVCDRLASGPITLSVYDQQAPAKPLFDRDLSPGEMLSMDSFKGRRMIGGITWSASGQGLTGWMVGSLPGYDEG